MTKQPKTPTLAQLRKLAKKLGYSVEVQRFRVAADRPNTYPHFAMDVGVKERGGMTLLISAYPKTRREGQAMLFAALSALPDKKGQR